MKQPLTVILFLTGVLIGVVLSAKPKPKQEFHCHYQAPQIQWDQPYKITYNTAPADGRTYSGD